MMSCLMRNSAFRVAPLALSSFAATRSFATALRAVVGPAPKQRQRPSSLFSPQLRPAHMWAHLPSLASRQRWFAAAAATKKPKLTVCYGSQTGTAMQFSYDLRKQGKKRGLDVTVIDLQDFEPETFEDAGLVVLVMACFGKGQPTSNAESFYEWLLDDERDEERDELFSGVTYTVFGLGQSANYPDNYQKVGIAVDKRLEELGARRFLPLGMGDDSGKIDQDFETWLENFFETLDKDGVELAEKTATSDEPHLHTRRISRPAAASGDEAAAVEYNVKNPYSSTVTMTRELHTASSPRSCIHVELEIGEGMSYTTGDYVGILPANDPRLVDKVGRGLNLNLELMLDLEEHPILAAKGVKEACSLREALHMHLDLCGSPKKAFFKQLARYASGADQRKLNFLGSGTDLANMDIETWCVQRYLGVMDVITAFPSVRHVPEDEFVDMLQPLTPRFYSIASSNRAHPSHVHVAASIVEHPKASVSMGLGHAPLFHEGVATSYIKKLRHGDQVPMFIKRSLFRMPEDPAVPVIMIGAGTGVAPFRGFLQDRHITQERAGLRGLGSKLNTLYFGIGRRDVDYLYEQELRRWVSEQHVNLVLAVGFEHAWYNFVQHRLVEPQQARHVWDVIANQGGFIYVCGDARNMGKAVELALVQICQQEGGMDETAAKQFVRELGHQGRYQKDTY